MFTAPALTPWPPGSNLLKSLQKEGKWPQRKAKQHSALDAQGPIVP